MGGQEVGRVQGQEGTRVGGCRGLPPCTPSPVYSYALMPSQPLAPPQLPRTHVPSRPTSHLVKLSLPDVLINGVLIFLLKLF